MVKGTVKHIFSLFHGFFLALYPSFYSESWAMAWLKDIPFLDAVVSIFVLTSVAYPGNIYLLILTRIKIQTIQVAEAYFGAELPTQAFSLVLANIRNKGNLGGTYGRKSLYNNGNANEKLNINAKTWYKDVKTFYGMQFGQLFMKWSRVPARKSNKILEKSLVRPYPQICTGVNGENLQLVRYQFSASIFWK